MQTISPYARANLFDGKNWGTQDVELNDNMQRFRGGDRRMCAVWDEKTKTIHLTYVERDGKLFHRALSSPYRMEDLSEPELLVDDAVTTVLSIDTTKNPSHL